MTIQQCVEEWRSRSRENTICHHCTCPMTHQEVRHPIPLIQGSSHLMVIIGSACSPMCAISYWHVRKATTPLHFLRVVLYVMGYGFCYGIQPLDSHHLKPLSADGTNPRDPRLHAKKEYQRAPVANRLTVQSRNKQSCPFPIPMLQCAAVDRNTRFRKKQSSLQAFFTK